MAVMGRVASMLLSTPSRSLGSAKFVAQSGRSYSAVLSSTHLRAPSMSGCCDRAQHARVSNGSCSDRPCSVTSWSTRAGMVAKAVRVTSPSRSRPRSVVVSILCDRPGTARCRANTRQRKIKAPGYPEAFATSADTVSEPEVQACFDGVQREAFIGSAGSRGVSDGRVAQIGVGIFRLERDVVGNDVFHASADSPAGAIGAHEAWGR